MPCGEECSMFPGLDRAAAARCRTKKKIWTNNLEKKAEEFQKANAALQVGVMVVTVLLSCTCSLQWSRLS